MLGLVKEVVVDYEDVFLCNVLVFEIFVLLLDGGLVCFVEVLVVGGVLCDGCNVFMIGLVWFVEFVLLSDMLECELYVGVGIN